VVSFFRFVLLTRLVARRKFPAAIAYASSHIFNGRYLVFSELKFAEAYYFIQKRDSALKIFKSNRVKIEKLDGLGSDEITYISNYLEFLISKIEGFRGDLFDKKELDINNVRKWISYSFWHGTKYD
jgi:hypothetical protein